MTATTAKATEESQLRRAIEDWATALRAKDIDRIMADYTPDVLVFDITPPLQHQGKEEHRKQWERSLASFEGPIGCEMRDLKISMFGDGAFSTCLNRISGKLKSGESRSTWMRVTVGYRKIDGKWMVTHEHVSVPVEPEIGKAALDLTP